MSSLQYCPICFFAFFFIRRLFALSVNKLKFYLLLWYIHILPYRTLFIQQRMLVISKCCCCCMLKIYKRRKWYHQSYAETFLASKHLWETSIRRYMDSRTRTPLYYSFLFVSRKESLHSFHYNIYIQKISVKLIYQYQKI